MAVFFTEGFDFNSVDPGSGFPVGWDVASANGLNTISAAGARTGPQGLTLGGSSQGRLLAKNFTSRTTMITGFAMNIQSLVVNTFVLWSDGAGFQMSLRVDATGGVQFFRGNAGTAIGPAASIVLGGGVWHYFEAKILIDATVGTVELKIDGVVVITATALNTKGSSTTGVTQVAFFGPSGTPWFFDDIVFIDTTGAINTTYIGDVRVQGAVPNANGTKNNFTQVAQSWVQSTAQIPSNQLIDSNGNLQQCITGGTTKSGAAPTWSTTIGVTTTDGSVTWRCVATAALLNFEFVNEPIPDGDNSYLLDSTVTDQERYKFPTTTASAVYAVTVKAIMRKDDVGTRSARLVVLSNGTTGDNGADLPISTNYSQLTGVFEADPNTSAAWTVARVNAAEYGVKVTA